jgi:hypothetical protein
MLLSPHTPQAAIFEDGPERSIYTSASIYLWARGMTPPDILCAAVEVAQPLVVGICYLGTSSLRPIPRMASAAARLSRRALEANRMVAAVAFPEQEGGGCHFLRSGRLPGTACKASHAENWCLVVVDIPSRLVVVFGKLLYECPHLSGRELAILAQALTQR